MGFGGGASASNITVTNNTVRNNGFATGGSGAASTEPIGMAAFDYAGTNVVFSRNLIRDNAGAGVLVMQRQRHDDHAEQFQQQRWPEHRSRSAGPSIPNNLGTPQGVTHQRQRRRRHRAQRPAQLSGGGFGEPDRYRTFAAGFARPDSAIELYIAQADPTGFGEGLTYLGTLTEGSPADLDATTGTYGPANINGLAQGTDNTNRFSFRITVPGGVAIGTRLHRHRDDHR